MNRKPSSIVWVVAIVLAMGALPAHALPSSSDVDAAALDDNVPGVPIPASPLTMDLDSVSDPDDVYSIWLSAGDTLWLSLTRGTAFTPASTQTCISTIWALPTSTSRRPSQAQKV